MNTLYVVGYFLVVIAYSGKLLLQFCNFLKSYKKSQEKRKEVPGRGLPDLIVSFALLVGYLLIFHGKILSGEI